MFTMNHIEFRITECSGALRTMIMNKILQVTGELDERSNSVVREVVLECDDKGKKVNICGHSGYGNTPFGKEFSIEIDEPMTPYLPESLLSSLEMRIVAPGAMYAAKRAVYGLENEVKDYKVRLIQQILAT